MKDISIEEMLGAGLHFGHQIHRWNPKMEPFIFGTRSGIHIIDLQKTVEKLKQALDFVKNLAGNSGIILFVGTKRQAQEIVAFQAERSGMPYITKRWLGGMLTNFTTISKNIKKFEELKELKKSEQVQKFTKKEKLNLQKEIEKLETVLSGVKEMTKLPDALFVVDVVKEKIAVCEAQRLGIPIIAICDTNACPEGIDYVIPANDDAIKAIEFLTSSITDAILEGKKKKSKVILKKAVKKEKAAEEKIAIGK
jgi:small subunit ribosomal protein S2